MSEIQNNNGVHIPWPWVRESYDDLYNRDDRFFAVLVKGVLMFLNENVVMYDKPIPHYILNTGSSMLYVEGNGYEYSLCEATGEHWMYSVRPRCVVELGEITVNTNEITQGNIRVSYERRDVVDNRIKGYNAEFRRIPLSVSLSLHYVLSNFNESIVLVEELIHKLAFQKYFNVVYLGETVQCVLEFPTNYGININKIDMSSADVVQKNVDIQLTLHTNYPCIYDETEVSNTCVIESASWDANVMYDDTDTELEVATTEVS